MKKILVILVKMYQTLVSPLFPGSCRFYPSCSQYAVDALTKHGSLKGSILSVKRIAKCHPFHPGGYDPA